MRAEQVDALMTQLGSVLDPLGIVAFPGSKSWGIMIDDDTSILIDLDEEQGKLVLNCEIGAPVSGERAQLYELMLRHNFLWHRTGGVRLAVDGERGNVVQLFDLPTEQLDVTRLDRAVRRFADSARAWRDIIRRPPPDDARESLRDAGISMIRA